MIFSIAEVEEFLNDTGPDTIPYTNWAIEKSAVQPTLLGAKDCIPEGLHSVEVHNIQELQEYLTIPDQDSGHVVFQIINLDLGDDPIDNIMRAIRWQTVSLHAMVLVTRNPERYKALRDNFPQKLNTIDAFFLVHITS